MTTQKSGSQRIGSALGGAFAILALVGLITGLNRGECQLSAFFGLSLKTLLEALPSLILAASHLVESWLFAHANLLDGLLRVSFSCGQVVLAFAGVA